MHRLATIVLSSSVLVFVAGASGAITGTTGQALQIAPPASAGPGALQSFQAFAWDEQTVTLATLFVNESANPGTSAAPTPGFLSGTFDSHFIHFENVPGVVAAQGTVSFNNPIVGVIFVNTDLDSTDASCGAFGTVYPTGYPLRGLATTPPSGFTYVGNTLSFSFINFNPPNHLCQVRVFTAVPAAGPAALAALGAGLGLRRRRR